MYRDIFRPLGCTKVTCQRLTERLLRAELHILKSIAEHL